MVYLRADWRMTRRVLLRDMGAAVVALTVAATVSAAELPALPTVFALAVAGTVLALSVLHAVNQVRLMRVSLQPDSEQ